MMTGYAAYWYQSHAWSDTTSAQKMAPYFVTRSRRSSQPAFLPKRPPLPPPMTPESPSCFVVCMATAAMMTTSRIRTALLTTVNNARGAVAAPHQTYGNTSARYKSTGLDTDVPRRTVAGHCSAAPTMLNAVKADRR